MATIRYHAGLFPPKSEHLDWQALIPSIGPAAGALARYDGMLSAMPNPDLLLAPLRVREAVLSSRIEGTQATMGDVLEFEAGETTKSSDRRDDILEVLNYRMAVRTAEDLLETLPLSQRVVRAAHEVLLSGARGAGKSPGSYRRVPNWIGSPGCGIEEARFVPIDADKVADAMNAWERYIHRTDVPDRLAQLAILHAEFEAVHPFLDGNGRLGRMLVPLFLWQNGIVSRPAFYISAYFEARRDVYFEKLLSVSRDGDWTRWCIFFLEAVRAQAEDNLERTKGILDLYDNMKDRVPRATRSRYAIRAIDWIFEHPIFRSSHFAAKAGIPERTAQRILDALCEERILEQIRIGAGRRAAIFRFSDLLDVAEGGSASGEHP